MTSAWWHVGPMARTVGDVALTYSILSGPDGVDGYAVHAKHFDSGSTRIPGQSHPCWMGLRRGVRAR